MLKTVLYNKAFRVATMRHNAIRNANDMYIHPVVCLSRGTHRMDGFP